MKRSVLIIFTLFLSLNLFAQSEISKILSEVADAPSPQRIEKDVRKLVSFGTRHTLSDTVSSTRGIGAARRWIRSEFERISKDCNNCLKVKYQKSLVPKDGGRIIHDTWIVNVLAIQKGNKYPNRYVIMSGDIDSRVTDINNFTSDAPGANDNATGMAGTLEAARVLSKYKFPVSIIYAGLSGEEQGLYGGKSLARELREKGIEVIGVLNNDMIGNIEGIDGVIDNSTFRVFSEAISMTMTDKEKVSMRYYGGEVDGPSRQLARYVEKLTHDYMTNLKAIMIYRLDRFGRGGHHRPFNDEGFTGVRIMETHENYNRQHQDIRTEKGIRYGDVIEGVNFEYAAKLTAVNTLILASLASAPQAPQNVMIGGVVKPSTTLQWDKTEDNDLLGYKIYWRDTTAPQWQYSKFVGQVNKYTLKNIIIDNYFFGVASVGKNGAESLVQFPGKLIPRK